MSAAIFFSGKYGSTEQYARWIGEATGLPVFDIKDASADPSKYEYLVLGSSILYFKLSIRKWASANLSKLDGRAKILFSVSGEGPSDKLNTWVANSFPPELLSQVEHVGLGGRLDHSKLSWLLRKILWVGSLINSDPEASKEERFGFDHVNKASIEPIVNLIKEYQGSKMPASQNL
ncbi:MAG: flavodoxin domain-containing protein [Gilvibacter sp.]